MPKMLEVRERFEDVFIWEGGYYVKNLNSYDDVRQAYFLRHEIFSKELGWVPEDPSLMEVDQFDMNCTSFGVFDKAHRLLAYLRLIITTKPFMLEEIFSKLIGPGHKVKKERDTAEITRLCISHDARKDQVAGNFGVNSISMFLYKGVFHWCLKNKVQFLYLVVEDKILRLLTAKGFPCHPIGGAQRMPDGVNAVAALMDWEEFRQNNILRRPKMMSWFMEYQSAQAPTRSPRHVNGLPHRASA